MGEVCQHANYLCRTQFHEKDQRIRQVKRQEQAESTYLNLITYITNIPFTFPTVTSFYPLVLPLALRALDDSFRFT